MNEKEDIVEQEIRLNYKEVIALVIAGYKVLLPKVAIIFVSIIMAGFLLKLILGVNIMPQ